MKTIKLKTKQFPPNLQAYLEKFGHPHRRGPEVQDTDGAGQDGGVSPGAGQADPQLGEQTEDQDGDEAGRLLRQQVVDFVSSQGEFRVSPQYS